MNIEMSAPAGLFIDTCNMNDIQKYAALGVIQGVTTNPTILAKARVTNWKEHCREIISAVYPLRVSVQVTSLDDDDILKQALEAAAWGDNTVLKIPITADGRPLLHVVREASKHLPINVTAVMSTQQGVLAALAKASYVSLFGGRIASMGHNPETEIRQLRLLLRQLNLDTHIIAGSVREARNVTDWLMAGADIVTVPPEILEKMFIHPGTKEVVDQFTKDAEKLK